ncbi:putative protein TPRXL [Leguminivora glycinivorella]|uniref:putative protein TPRXL n=1 Tax=Leguminivora glycinivorella TaxID=1035111 RepID=UPI0020107376|nr:putative protein TPRXL [Leguminivora glycinivorella]
MDVCHYDCRRCRMAEELEACRRENVELRAEVQRYSVFLSWAFPASPRRSTCADASALSSIATSNSSSSSSSSSSSGSSSSSVPGPSVEMSGSDRQAAVPCEEPGSAGRASTGCAGKVSADSSGSRGRSTIARTRTGTTGRAAPGSAPISAVGAPVKLPAYRGAFLSGLASEGASHEIPGTSGLTRPSLPFSSAGSGSAPLTPPPARSRPTLVICLSLMLPL